MKPVDENMSVAAAAAAAELNLYFQTPDSRFKLYQGDCLTVMDTLDEESIDVVITDPPYFLSGKTTTCQSGKRVKTFKGKWDIASNVNQLYAFSFEWLTKVKRVLKPEGTLFVFGTYHTIYVIGYVMQQQQLDFKILNNITWCKPNPPPNLNCRCFTHSTETIIWAAKQQRSKYVFNYQEMKKENNNKQMKDLWIMSSPHKAEKRHGKHPTQKPCSLLSRIVRASTHPDQTVLDPFSGSGTTGIASALNNRRYIGIELNKDYLETTIKRINDLETERKSK